jgi:alkylhydroperoxidase family enzyme
MTANFENNCHYCTAGHSWGMHAAKMPEDIIDALREGRPLADPKLQSLRQFAKELLVHNGHIGNEWQAPSFLGACHSPTLPLSYAVFIK